MPPFRSLLLLCPAWFAVVACSSSASTSDASATGGVESASSGAHSLAGGPGSGGSPTSGGKVGSGGSDTSTSGGSDGGSDTSTGGGKSGSGGSDTSTGGGKSGSGGANTGGGSAGGAGGARASTGGVGAASVGGATGTGGAGGAAQGGAGAVSAGAGAGGQATTLACRDGTNQLVPEMKDCASDDDCQAVPTYNCCGPGQIVGLAKKAQAYLACLQTTPPAGCGLRGCASYPSTEDNQSLPINFSDSVSVIARCYEVAGGRKACMTTVQGSCSDNVTRCLSGETCKNECDQPCSCQQGYMVCARPTSGSACSMAPKSCRYQTAPGASVSSVCECTVAAAVWSCPG